ncbi:GntR family transcriptional regulator [Myceligenerans crystallogenes]|uniref:Regulatory protein, tetR family n=1 Tax=Myceligenerans crystallogenes TaxID=316335 RepID=A0ABN2NIN5_9MICO
MPTTSERIAAAIRARIDAGELAPGDRVPSTRQIVAEHGVAMATATRVLALLRNEGLVESRQGSGTVVTGTGGPADRRWPGERNAPVGPAARIRSGAPARQGERSTRGGSAVVGQTARAKRASDPTRDGVASKPASGATRDGVVPKRASGPTRNGVLLKRASGPTRDDVVRAAVAIADDDGLAGLSMRRVATALGVPTMSLYRHVRSREDLVTWMMDAFYAEMPLPDPLPDGWRARAEACARVLWAGFERHPWAAQALSMTRPQIAPHGMAFTETLLAVFGEPIDMNTRMHLAVSVVQLVRGVAVGIEPARAARQDTGISDEEWMDRALPDLQAVASPARYPHLARATTTELDLTLDSLFEFGLSRLLDGYTHFLNPEQDEGQ